MRALLFGPRKPGTHSIPDQPAKAPAHAMQPSPEIWGALLVLARLRRAGRTPAPLDAVHAQGETSTLVRAYILPPEEHQQDFSVRQFAEASR
ncbi:hypothetical protein [Streptomyces sp. NBC_00878]|uniref:hypothetical protein n=1 Tax=Streptomyces sp. NBC_00878 TaxID=2975854 RepID=UPI002256010E|nr:hypothetical protein [Streptomyces sp. NBC_00878]MCX4905452.1 hypothetical protein [Streptomyces sp. NBC_00878]